jgi:hypothetical protein
MSLNYFLLCKRLAENNLLLINELINNYNKMYTELMKEYDCLSECDEIYHYKIMLKLRTEYIVKRKEQEELLEFYKTRISRLCQHNFIEDNIDITPEQSQKILYCPDCELTQS